MTESEAINFIKHNRHGWRTFQFQDSSLLNNERRVFRGLPDIREHEFNAIASYLDDYGDPKNANKSAVVVAPEVDDQELDGTWRHLSCRLVRTDANGRENPDGKHFTIVQELAKGFLTALDYDEARLIQEHYTTGDGATNADAGKWFTLEWRAFDPDLVDSVCESKIATATQTGVKYRRASIGVGEDATVDINETGKTFKFYAIDPELQEDGTTTVRVSIGDTQYQLDGFASWLGSRQSAETFYYRVPESLAQGVIDTAKARGADAIPTGYDNSLGLVNIRVSQMDTTGVSLSNITIAKNCDTITTADFIWGTGDSNALPIPTTIPNGVTYRRNIEERGDGTFNVRLTKETRQLRDIPEYNSELRADQTTARKEWKGVTDSSVDSSLNAQTGKVVRVRREKRDDCSEDIDRDVITPTNQSWTDEEVRADKSSVTTRNTHSATEAPTPTQVDGKIRRTQNRETEFGTFNTSEEEITAVEQSVTHASSSRADQTAERTVTTNEAIKADAPTSSPGQIGSATSRKNAFGLYDNQVETVTAVAQATTHDSQSRADQTASRTVETNAIEKADASGGGSGTIVNAQSRENEFGRFDNTIETITANEQSVTHEAENRADQTTSRTVTTNASTKADAPATTTGVIGRARSQQNEFGLYDNEEQTITAVDQASSSYQNGPYLDVNISENTNSTTAEADPGTPAVGTFKRVDNRPTEFGTFATRVVTETQSSTDTGWYDAGNNKSGTIKKRVATGQTETDAENIANSAPAGNWFTNGNISGPDKFGHYSATVVATEKEIGFSVTVPYKSYAFDIPGEKVQYKTIGGVTWKRTLSVTHYYVGDTQESDVDSYLTGKSADGIRVTPNGTGEYFQGYGYKITSTGNWEKDNS